MFDCLGLIESWRALGRFHMVLLHLPIGLLFGLILVAWIKSDRYDNALQQMMQKLLWFWIIATGLTIILGVILGGGNDYNVFAVETHRNLGYWLGGCALLTGLIHSLSLYHDSSKLYLAYKLLLLVALVLTTLTGHQGGTLTHGDGYLAFAFKKSKNEGMLVELVAGRARNEEEEKAYTRVAGILKENCLKCHGPKKQKGEYRLDDRANAFSGGESEIEAIVPFDIYYSEMVRRIKLPQEHDNVMPPEGKGELAPEEIEAIEEWIKNGAWWPGDPNSAVTAIKAKRNATSDWSPATIAIIEELKLLNASVESTYWETGGIMVDLSYVNNPDWKLVCEKLLLLKNEIVWLDFSRQELAPIVFESLAQLPKLKRLHIERSNVTDDHLKLLNPAPNLEYLNLYNTSITDASIAVLKEFPKLNKVYLLNTKISKKKMTELRKMRPGLQVVGE